MEDDIKIHKSGNRGGIETDKSRYRPGDVSWNVT